MHTLYIHSSTNNHVHIHPHGQNERHFKGDNLLLWVSKPADLAILQHADLSGFTIHRLSLCSDAKKGEGKLHLHNKQQ